MKTKKITFSKTKSDTIIIKPSYRGYIFEITFALIFLGHWFNTQTKWSWITLGFGLLIGLYIIVHRHKELYIASPRGTYHKGGLWKKFTGEFSWEQVKDIEISRTFLQALLGIGDIHFISKVRKLDTWKNVHNPKELWESLHHLKSKHSPSLHK